MTNSNFECFDYRSIQINAEEHVQSNTFNKELYKLYSDILQIKNNILGRFYGIYDGFSALQQKNYSYISSDDIAKLNIDDSYDIWNMLIYNDKSNYIHRYI